MFIPRTEGGKLIGLLRRCEQDLSAVSSVSYRRIKLIESAGDKLKNILVKNPWNREPCDRPECSSCAGEHPQPEMCRQRSVVGTHAHYVKLRGRKCTIWEKRQGQ